MGRIKDLNSSLPGETDNLVFDGLNGTRRISYADFKQKLIDDGFGSGSSEAVVLTQAEYNALPEEVKDSDTIFFISDAPFDSPNVVTLTRAEYDALSTADKMDGRFYYITDDAEVATSLVVQTNQNNPDTVPSSKVVYDELSHKARIYKSFADLGTNLTSLTIYQILERMERSSIFQGSFTTSQITNLKKNGDVFIFKAASDNVVQKSIIILNCATQSATEPDTYVGFMRYDTHEVIWYDNAPKMPQARTSQVTIASIGGNATQDVNVTIGAFTGNPIAYSAALFSSSNTYPIAVRSVSGNTASIRFYNSSSSTATNLSLAVVVVAYY